MRRLLVAGVVLFSSVPAHAGRTHFGWLYGTDIIPERGTELETWIVEENKHDGETTNETTFWWGPVIALTEHVELAIPFEVVDVGSGAYFSKWGGELRYRPQSPDPIEAGPFATLFRVAAKRLVQDHTGVRAEADAVASYQDGRLFVLADVGGILEHSGGADEIEVRPGAGVSVRVVDDFRLGVEGYSELIVQGGGPSWFVIGPTASLTRGRFWGAATLGIGVFGIRDAPRLTFGVAL